VSRFLHYRPIRGFAWVLATGRCAGNKSCIE
jgi:hypothetical protein